MMGEIESEDLQPSYGYSLSALAMVPVEGSSMHFAREIAAFVEPYLSGTTASRRSSWSSSSSRSARALPGRSGLVAVVAAPAARGRTSTWCL